MYTVINVSVVYGLLDRMIIHIIPLRKVGLHLKDNGGLDTCLEWCYGPWWCIAE